MKASSLLEPQQFGSWLHEPFLARASQPGAELGRHALGAFLTLRLADRFRPDEEPSHPLALAYQVRATRDYLLDLHPHNAEVKYLLEVVRLADAVQKGGGRSLLWPPLLGYAHWLEQELQLDEALDVVETSLGLGDGCAPGEEIAALLQRGRILRQLGRLEEARASYDDGRARAVVAGDTHSALLGRIGDAIVMRQLGNLPGSERALRQIIGDAERLGDVDALARAHHDLGAVYNNRREGHRAIPHLYQAFELYEDAANRLRALSDVGEALKAQGHYGAAEDAFLIALNTGGTKQTRAVTMIALLELSALMDQRLSFARWKKEIEPLAEELPAERLADFYFQLGLGQAFFGQAKQAVRSLTKALAVSERHHLNDYAFRIRGELETVKKTAARHGAGQGPCRAEEPLREGALIEIASKLHALRMAS